MEFDFECIRQPGEYCNGADVMFSLPQKATDKAQNIADIDKNIPAFCSDGQMSKLNIVFKKYEDDVGPSPTTKELIDIQENDVMWQNLKEVLKKNGNIA